MKNKKSLFYALSSFVFITIIFSCGQKNGQPPFSPEDALSTFEIADGFKIELVASEPLIKDPTEIAFDEDGKMYVAQMQDYPSDGAPICNIMLLEDKDNDGYYETGTVFAENLAYVNGVMPWKKGVLVTSAPDIFYLEDTDGDGSADIKDVVLTGFAVTNPQLRMSSLRYGLDNWIYGAYSRSGGNGRYPEFSDKGSPLSFPSNTSDKGPDIYPGTDFRFRPDEAKVEPSGGMSQFGLSFDAAGNRFTVWNNAHLRHVVIDARYLERNSFLSMNTVMASLPEHGDAAPVFPITKNKLDLHESEIGHFTSACGNTIYTGNLFDGSYKDASFVCEPVSNLVHIDFLEQKDATFVGRRDQENSEFLSSTDSWFRPVNSTVGPDGALYIVDFYRKLVEHPAWIARANEKGIFTHAGILQESDFLEGNDRGRIYRVVPDDYKRDGSQHPKLSKATTEELVSYLEHPNRWWRINSQRLIVDREDKNAGSLIKNVVRSKSSSLGKIHALWTLHALGELDNHTVLNAFKDEDPIVRKQAILLAEDRLDNVDIQNGLLALESDSDAHVQFQFVLTSTAIPGTALKPLINIAKKYIYDPWFQSAVLLGSSESPLSFYREISAFNPTDQKLLEGKYLFLERNSSIIGAKNDQSQIVQLLGLISESEDEDNQTASLKGLDEGLKRISGSLVLPQESQNTLVNIINKSSPKTQSAALKLASQVRFNNSKLLQSSIDRAIQVAINKTATDPKRIIAIKIIGLDPDNKSLNAFEDLLSPEQSSAVQKAAVEILIGKKNGKANALLLNNWDHYNLTTRGIVETGFLNDQTRLMLLIEGLESRKIKPDWLSKTARTRLIEHSNPSVSGVAKGVFKDIPPDDREEILIDYYETTTTKGDIEKGKVVFKSACSACHVLEGVGNNFGPDLLSVSHQTRVNLLTMILNPNHNIAPGYEGYMIEDKEGQTFAGIIVSENNSGVMLRSAGGAEQTILRENIKSVIPMNNSLMPEGLEASINKDQMVDLLEYLKTLGQ